MTDETEATEQESPFLKVAAGFQLSIDRLNDAITRQSRALERQLSRLPITTVLERQATLAAGIQTSIVNFGTPLPGHRWVVRLLGAIENPVGTAALNTASVITWYVGPEVSPAAGVLVATNARWQFRQIPDFQRFTSDSFHVWAGQSLIAGLAAMPVGGSNTALIAGIDDSLMGERLNG